MSGELLFRRRVQVVVASPLTENFSTISAQVMEIEKLRVSFKVSKSLTKDPNTAEIKVYNLSEATRAKLPGKAAKIVLRAGYESTEDQIYIGDARTIESKKENADWITTFRCGDGERAVQHARVNASFAAGTPVSDIINTLGRAAKVDTGNLSKIAAGVPSSTQYTQGYAASGLALKELEKVLKFAGYELSIQDGALQALKPGEATTEEVILLAPDSGLIGSPELAAGETKEGKNKAAAKPVLKAKSLLQGKLRPGRRVQVQSRQFNGLYRCVKVEHAGDTDGQDWFSSLELETA